MLNYLPFLFSALFSAIMPNRPSKPDAPEADNGDKTPVAPPSDEGDRPTPVVEPRSGKRGHLKSPPDDPTDSTPTLEVPTLKRPPELGGEVVEEDQAFDQQFDAMFQKPEEPELRGRRQAADDISRVMARYEILDDPMIVHFLALFKAKDVDFEPILSPLRDYIVPDEIDQQTARKTIAYLIFLQFTTLLLEYLREKRKPGKQSDHPLEQMALRKVGVVCMRLEDGNAVSREDTIAYFDDIFWQLQQSPKPALFNAKVFEYLQICQDNGVQF